ncbi:hypothetical protein AVEN_164475-1 [Araneus ventricosus]|uniref:Uncharacterized protein n=1 Tax=Araneus ventricosus TaxID=182803 RepID=A0A4Y1ZTV3_ARAVE|nr:hypothetical protein AVEN_164475-1 [Araneus ventricosus]
MEANSGPANPTGCKAETRKLEEFKILRTVPRPVAEIKTELGGKHCLDPHQWGDKDGYKGPTHTSGEIKMATKARPTSVGR